MERDIITDQVAEEVVGGSIVFTSDHSTCGLNCNNQCRVNDYDAAIAFIAANYKTMREKDMMKQMMALGYITRL
jgi:hypothetical protein